MSLLPSSRISVVPCFNSNFNQFIHGNLPRIKLLESLLQAIRASTPDHATIGRATDTTDPDRVSRFQGNGPRCTRPYVNLVDNRSENTKPKPIGGGQPQPAAVIGWKFSQGPRRRNHGDEK
jgi:hypothetical protein